jgi:hypothetical protein
MNAALQRNHSDGWQWLVNDSVRLKSDQVGTTALQRPIPNNVPHNIRNVSQALSPSHHNHGANDMGEAIGETRRNPGTDRTETRTSLHVRLVEHVTEPTKDVLRKVPHISADSIDAYRQKNVPQAWAQMIAFGRAYPGFALDIMEMMGIDIDRDRNAYATFLQLQKQVRGE